MIKFCVVDITDLYMYSCMRYQLTAFLEMVQVDDQTRFFENSIINR